jgi:3-methyladenine DNA glycosylase AlkD
MNSTEKSKKVNDEFTTLSLDFISNFFIVFKEDYSYTRVVMETYFKEESGSFIDESIEYSNWENRDMLLNSYVKLKKFIKKHPELLNKLDNNQRHYYFFSSIMNITSLDKMINSVYTDL